MRLTIRIVGLAAVLAGGSAVPDAALAEIKVGVTIAATGPAAALGVPAKNTFALWPAEIARREGHAHRAR